MLIAAQQQQQQGRPSVVGRVVDIAGAAVAKGMLGCATL